MFVFVLFLVSSLFSLGSLGNIRSTQQDVERQNEASRVLTVVYEVINNNSGRLPTAFDKNGISGEEFDEPYKVQLFAEAGFARGAQDNLTTDMIRLVVQASCDGDRVVNGAQRSFVIQYTIPTNDGYSSRCLAG